MKRETKWVELGEIAEETYTGTLITKSQIVTEGIPCIRYGEIYTIYDIWCDRVISRAKLDPSKKYRYCKKGDLLITKVGETVTEIAKPLAYLGKEKILVDSATIVLLHKQNPKYLAYALSTTNIKKQKNKIFDQGPAIVNIRAEQALKLKIPLPSFKKQEKIAKWLDAFSTLERQLERQLERHKSRYKYYLNRLMREGQEVELKDVIKESFSGTSITKSQITTEGTPCVKCGDIYSVYNIWFDETISHFQPEQGKKYKYCEEGDLLVTTASVIFKNIGKSVAYLGKNLVAIDGDIIALKHSQNPKYLSYVLSSQNIETQKQKLCNKNSTVAHINAEQLAKFKIPLPSLDRQEKIANWLDKFRELTDNISKGLPREILLLKQQSRYYREKLIG